MPRSVFKGAVAFNPFISAQISLYKATEDDRTALKTLNPATNNPIEYRPVDSVTKEVVSRADIVKGYEHEPGQFVVITSDDLESLAIEGKDLIQVTGYCQTSELSSFIREEIYFLSPNGTASAEAYFTFAAAMAKTRTAGLCTIIYRGRERQAVVEPVLFQDEKGEKFNYLTLTTLRTQAQIRKPEDHLKIPTSRPSPEAVKLATEIINSKLTPFTLSYRDRYQAALTALIKAKLAGGVSSVKSALGKRIAAKPGRTAVVNLLDSLRASLASADAEKNTRPRKSKSNPETTNDIAA